MEAYEIDAIKMEKQKAMRRYRTFQKIANFVRTLEIFIAIIIISWLISAVSAYIPSAMEISGKILRRLSSILFSPRFIFILGNAIVITLFAKSGDRTSSSAKIVDDVISGEIPAVDGGSEVETVKVPVEENKNFQRTQSSLEMVVVEKKKELRGSETEPKRKVENGESPAKRRIYEVDELSSDEFRIKVEAFIEKQQRILREECKSVVVSKSNNFRCNSM